MAQRETVDTAVIVRHFEEADGCPVCSFEREAEAYEIDRLLDGNMMIWDIRRDTDAMGFCYEHYAKLLASRNRFSVAVMLESHLKEVRDVYLKELSFKTGKGGMAERIGALNHDCYVCNRMKDNMATFLSGVVALWKKREEFRELFASKPICLNHYGELLATAEQELDKKTFKAFSQAMYDAQVQQVEKLAEEAKFYCSRFDYRVTGPDKDFKGTADILERMCEWLNKKNPKKLW